MSEAKSRFTVFCAPQGFNSITPGFLFTLGFSERLKKELKNFEKEIKKEFDITVLTNKSTVGEYRRYFQKEKRL
jgi:hypothetical protein